MLIPKKMSRSPFRVVVIIIAVFLLSSGIHITSTVTESQILGVEPAMAGEMKPPTDYGEGVYFFHYTDFGRQLAAFKAAHPEWRVIDVEARLFVANPSSGYWVICEPSIK